MDTSIGDTFGAMLIGAFVAMGIYGITTLQMYYYFLTFRREGLGMKLLVSVIWIIDTLHVIFMCHSVYHYLISGFGNPKVLVSGIWSLYTSLLTNIIMAFIVQCYFTLKIHQICPTKQRWWISSVICFAVMAHLCFGIETVVFFFIKKDFARLKDVEISSVMPFGVTAILSDIFIAVALCVLLANNRSDFEDTNNIINKLIIYAINRCILTTIVAIVELIVFAVIPNTFYSFAIDFIIGKLYANSLLAALNSRKSLRETLENINVSTDFNVASVAAEQRPPSLYSIRNRENANRRGMSVQESKHTMTGSTVAHYI